jgi:hypothetical protein
MALLSFRGISTPSLPAQGGQRRFSYFNIQRGNPTDPLPAREHHLDAWGNLLGWSRRRNDLNTPVRHVTIPMNSHITHTLG